MRAALQLARRGYGTTSPNPMVGALLVRKTKVIGRGWHHHAGGAHAEVEAIQDARARGISTAGATLYVTLEPCCTHGRTPPCTQAIENAGITRVVAATLDPNPAHAGRGFRILRRSGIQVTKGVLSDQATQLNEAFNHWIVHRTPFVTVKAAMTLDGKIATASGESKWITGSTARAYGMKLRQGADAILVGVNTILSDNPSLTLRAGKAQSSASGSKKLRRIILDAYGRTPLKARVVGDEWAGFTTVVVIKAAPRKRVEALSSRVQVWVAPGKEGRINLRWLLRKLGEEEVAGLLVEGGGEVNGSFLLQRLAHRVAFFYAPRIFGGRDAVKAVAGEGVQGLDDAIRLRDVAWRRLGPDLLLTARVG